MKTLKENFFGNLGIGKKAAIEDWLKKYDIRNYTINPDFTIDVNGNVNLAFVTFTNGKLPDYIQFNYVKKIFNICNTNLTSLKGCPKECEEFNCFSCENLISLEGAPEKCNDFDCGYTSITSLEGAPKECKNFSCNICHNLTSLEGALTVVENHFTCVNCQNLKSLNGPLKKCHFFTCEKCNKLKSLKCNITECDVFICTDCPNIKEFKNAPKCNLAYCDEKFEINIKKYTHCKFVN